MKRSHSIDIFVSTELDTFSMNPEEHVTNKKAPGHIFDLVFDLG